MQGRKVAVLLVGKGPRNTPTLEDHLARHGCDVCFATSINEALGLFQKRHFDLVLSEFLLSDGTAYQLHPQLLDTGATMFISNAVEDGCWWMNAIFEGKDRLGEPGMRPSEFRVRLDEILFDRLFPGPHKPAGVPPNGLIDGFCESKKEKHYA
jgi:response regulator RpfG family c-di-GMP phosphodiesterase